jgi:hypothetical protein
VTVRWNPLSNLSAVMAPGLCPALAEEEAPPIPECQCTQPTSWEADQAAQRATLAPFVERARRPDKVDARWLV